MTAETIEAVNHGSGRFREIFGRRPRGNDRVFPDAYLTTTVDYKREIGQAMHQANLPPELIYAAQKTDRLLGDTGLATEVELEEWNGAITEYFEKLASGNLQSAQEKTCLGACRADQSRDYCSGHFYRRGTKLLVTLEDASV